jgi:hypothetical protein
LWHLWKHFPVITSGIFVFMIVNQNVYTAIIKGDNNVSIIDWNFTKNVLYLFVLMLYIGLTVGILVSYTPGGQDFNLLTRDVKLLWHKISHLFLYRLMQLFYMYHLWHVMFSLITQCLYNSHCYSLVALRWKLPLRRHCLICQKGMFFAKLHTRSQNLNYNVLVDSWLGMQTLLVIFWSTFDDYKLFLIGCYWFNLWASSRKY